MERLSAEVGYWLGRTIGGGELRARLSRCWLITCFRKPNYSFVCLVYEYNPASMKVLEKVGFTRQAIL
ncbi:MAG: GNAT family N-acetyltransferase [Butyricimonas faecihominis]